MMIITIIIIITITFWLSVQLTLAPLFSSSSTISVCPGIQVIPSGVDYILIIIIIGNYNNHYRISTNICSVKFSQIWGNLISSCFNFFLKSLRYGHMKNFAG